MFEFFDWVVDTVTSLLDFVWQMVNGLLKLIGMLPSATTTLTDSVDYLPSILMGFATATVTISVILMIAGRSGGGKK